MCNLINFDELCLTLSKYGHIPNYPFIHPYPYSVGLFAFVVGLYQYYHNFEGVPHKTMHVLKDEIMNK